ncbi:MAG: TonB-dependent receptor [Sandaracinus sp.]
MSPWIRTATAIAIYALVAPALGLAQSTAAPPALRAPVEATRPSERPEEEVTVVLTVTVEVDGSVGAAEVAESGGAAFDEAARAAVLQFFFTPAMRDGAPRRARIRYRYVFPPVAPLREPVPVPVPAPAPERELVPEPEVADEDDEDDVPDDEIARFSVTGVVAAPPREGASHRVEGAALTQMAGTRGDALRAAELLPGVGRPTFGLGVLLVRGAAPQDSQYLLGDVAVPLPYHFGGITSFFPSHLIAGFDLMLASFGVRYGRATGGILRIEPRDPREDGLHGHVDVNVIDASASLEGPVSPQLSVALAARRSYIDAVLSAISIPGLAALPAYYDYQALVLFRPDAADAVRLALYGSDDQWIPSSAAPPGAFQLGVNRQFHRVQLGWQHDYSADVRHDLTLALGYDRTAIDVGGVGGTLRQRRTTWPITVRGEWTARLSENARLAVGLDTLVLYDALDFGFRSDDGPTEDPTQSTDDHRASDRPIVRPAIYAQGRFTFAPIELVVGVRADAYTEIGRVAVAPRLVSFWHATSELDVRAGLGLFTQPPEIAQTLPRTGSAGLGPSYAVHADLGVDLSLSEPHLTVALDGFVRSTFDRVVGPSGDERFSTSAFGQELATSTGLDFAPTSHLTNEGLARSYGMELSARLAPTPSVPLLGFLSYTLMRSEWRDHPGEDWHLSPFDQTHILTCSLTWQIGDGWEIGATFRLVSGNPTTPLTGAVNDLNDGFYRAVRGSPYAGRNDPFHRLDARVSKRFTVGDVAITVYLDVQNAYNASNPEGRTYNYDYTASVPGTGLPIVASLGLRGEL